VDPYCPLCEVAYAEPELDRNIGDKGLGDEGLGDEGWYK